MTKVWFVTGSSRGLGRAIVEAALKAGNRVAASARNPAQLGDLVETYGDAIRPIALDVTDAEAAKRAIGEAVAAFGRLDVVVNNAGYGDMAAFEDMSEAAFRAQIDTNFYGTVHVTRAALPVLRAQGSGHLMPITSIGGRTTAAGLSAYQAAKFAVEGFAGNVAAEVKPLGIKTTIVEPGGFRTDWAGSSMTIPPVSAPYEQTVGQFVKYIREGGYQAAGDPAKAAKVLLEVADLAEPPLRLILGTDAYQMVTAFERARTEEDARWLQLTNATEAEG